jgi:hypothetical protein
VNLCLPLGFKRREVDRRIKDTVQDKGDKCTRVFSKISWRQPLLTTLPWTYSHPRLALREKVEIKLGSGQQKSRCGDTNLR